MSLMCDVDSRVRSKLLLTNLEEAKRAEFERRRKLRLQQVRQQSCEFASKIRKNVSTEVQKFVKNENKKVDEKCRGILEKQQGKIKKAMENASTALHGAQKCANLQEDLAAIVKEKEDLQTALARARAAIAERREKDTRQALREKDTNIIDRKSVVRQIENTRSVLIARLPPVELKSPRRASPTRKSSRPVVQRSKPPDSPSGEKKSKDLRGIIKKTTTSPSKSVKLPPKRPTECTIASPVLVRSRQGSNNENDENRKPVAETNLDSSGCYDSDSTWPPRSTAKVTKTSIPQTIRVYNHNDGKCSEFIRPWKSVTHLDSLTDLDMVSNLEKEEAHNIRQTDLDERRRKLRETRGARALKKERARHEFESMIQRMTDLDKKERIRRAVNVEYPPEVHVREPLGKIVPKKKMLRFEDDEGNPCIYFHEATSPSGASHIPDLTSDTEGVIPVTETRFNSVNPDHNDECLRHIVDRMEKTREKLLRDAQYNSSDDDEDDDVDVPRWISDADCFRAAGDEEVVTNDARVHKSPIKVRKAKKTRRRDFKKSPTKKKVKKGKSSRKKTVVAVPASKIDRDSGGESRASSPLRPDDPDESFPFKEHPCDLIFNESYRENRVAHPRKEEEKPPEIPSSSNGSSSSSSSFHGDVKVIVEVKGKKKKNTKKGTQTAGLTPVPENEQMDRVKPANKKDVWSQTLPTSRLEYTSSSTSYNSPPEQLSPEQRKMLVQALNNVQNKNKENPKLREYIGRLLTMSRQSVSDLEVSTSDVSIDSDIFNSRNGSLTSRPVTRPQRRIHLVSDASETVDGSAPRYQDENDDDDRRRMEKNRTILDLLNVISEFQRVVQNGGGGGEQQRRRPPDFDGTTGSSYRGVPDNMTDPPIVRPRSPEAPAWRLSQTNFFERTSDGDSSTSGPSYDLPRNLQPNPPAASRQPREAPDLARAHRPAPPVPPHQDRRELSTIAEASVNIPRAEQCPTRREMALSDAETTISSISSSPARPKVQPRQRSRHVIASHSSSSDVSTFDLITSRDLQDKDLEETSSDLEKAFQSLGLNWALSTLKRTRDSKRRFNSDTTTSSPESRDAAAVATSSKPSRSKRGSSGYRHSTPLVRTPERGGGAVDEASSSQPSPPPSAVVAAQPPPSTQLPQRLIPPNLTLSHPIFLTKPS